MEIKVVRDKAAMSELVAEMLINKIKTNVELNLGLATGSTFTGVYERLVEACKENRVTFENISTFNLDEYLDIDKNHPQTFRNFMDRHLFDHVDIEKERTFFPPTDPDDDYEAFDDFIQTCGGIDIQLLGIGENAHIGFNEPGTPFDQKTHVIRLAEETRKANEKFFDSLDDVPRYAVTMGIDTIMGSRKIIIAAYGEHKAEAIKDMVEGGVNEAVPASILQEHPNVIVIVDEKAASLLRNEKDET